MGAGFATISLNCRKFAVELALTILGRIGALQKRRGTPAAYERLDLFEAGRNETGLVGERQRFERTLNK